MERISVTVGHKNADFTGSDNNIIQAAVDRVASLGGGIVNILEGTYIMEDSLHLRSGVLVRGCGEKTVLKKGSCVSSPVDGYLGYGHFDVFVKHPEKFRPGMGVYIIDKRADGFFSTVATIKSIHGNALFIDRMLNSDIREALEGRVVTVFPVVSGSHIKNAGVENLVIDGNAEENEYINGCRGGGLFLIQAHDIIVRNVTVRNFNGDGISFQQCVNTLIEDCVSENNRGHGMHPGSGSVGSIIRRNRCSDNGDDGVYYCLRVSFTLFEDNVIENNRHDGISIGHRDWDTIIRNNVIRGNGRHGIYVRPDGYGYSACRNVIKNNRFENNCRLVGDSEICIESAAEDLQILDNDFVQDAPGKKGIPVVRLNVMPARLVLHGNECHGRQLVSCRKKEFESGIVYEAPGQELPVGPENIPGHGTLHLIP